MLEDRDGKKAAGGPVRRSCSSPKDSLNSGGRGGAQRNVTRMKHFQREKALIDRLLEEEKVMSSRAPTFPALQAGGWGVIY